MEELDFIEKKENAVNNTEFKTVFLPGEEQTFKV